MSDVAIIGAGPYGLSIAAHLNEKRCDFRVFGTPMQMWRERMPQGMRLKSEGFASGLYEPGGSFTLSQYCRERKLIYADTGRPVEIDTFIDYGLAFQKKFAPMVEDRMVTVVRPSGAGGFEVELDDGETLSCRRVVMAVGLCYYAHVAPPLDGLPPELVSHSSARSDYRAFRGRRVAVVGGGASAADCAAELIEAGAAVHVLTRKKRLPFQKPPRRRTIRNQVRAPLTTIGGGWKNVFFTRGPLLFHRMPETFRRDVVRAHLGPAPCWFSRDIIESQATVLTEVRMYGASVRGDEVLLQLDRNGERMVLECDHVIAATGYKVDLDRLPMLSPDLRAEIRSAERTPILSASFESSVPGLYFVGPSSANAFGPLVRFACGAEFTARRISKTLARGAASAPATAGAA